MLGRQGATYATSQTLVEFKDSALHSLDGTVNAVQACSPASIWQSISEALVPGGEEARMFIREQ